MSNQEAIALLRNLEDALDSYCELNEEGKTAFRMAIEALSCSENPNNSDCISRQAAIDAVKRLSLGETDVVRLVMRIEDYLERLSSAQPEPAIPLSWIEGQIRWLKGLNNAFSTLTAKQILAMMNKWKDEQNG